MHVARCELEMPQQLAGRAAQSDDRIRVQVIALAAVGIEVGFRIADPPIQGVRLRVIGAGHPGAGAAALPRITGPGLVPGYARPRNRVESPPFLPGVCVVGCDEPTAVFRRRADACHDQIPQREWSCADVRAGIGRIDCCFPGHLAGGGFERGQFRVPGTDEDVVVEHGDTAILADGSLPASYSFVRMLVHPDAVTVRGVQRDDGGRRDRHEQNSVTHDRRRLDLVRRILELHHPTQA